MSVEMSRDELEPHDIRGHPMPAGPRTSAIITMVHDEPVFLPIWLRYYSRFFAPGDIYVLDDDSTGGASPSDEFVRIRVANDRVDHRWMLETIEGLQHELLDRYDLVVVTDVDEIIAPDPERGALDSYLARFDQEWVNCLGYEILHLKDLEPPLALEQPILAQRKYWYANGTYDKPALATMPMKWTPGFHGRADRRVNPDRDLRLIHLHRMDYDICLQRHRARRQRPWAEFDTREGWGDHNRITDKDEFDHWFYEDGYVGGFEIELEEISAAWREVL